MQRQYCIFNRNCKVLGTTFQTENAVNNVYHCCVRMPSKPNRCVQKAVGLLSPYHRACPARVCRKAWAKCITSATGEPRLLVATRGCMKSHDRQLLHQWPPREQRQRTDAAEPSNYSCRHGDIVLFYSKPAVHAHLLIVYRLLPPST